METEESTPKYLYKILSWAHWQASENRKILSLAGEDQDFIHFSREDQLDRILTKYWANVPKYAILKIDVEKLPGKSLKPIRAVLPSIIISTMATSL